MLTRTHLAFSILIYLLLFNSLQEKILFFIFLMFATIIVDIDSKKSMVGKFILLRPLQVFISHRGVLHTLFACFVFSFLIYLFNQFAAWGFLVGYLSHLFLDFLTSGVELLWPLKIKMGLGIKTGGLIEEIFFVGLFLVDLMLSYKIFFVLLKI
jgi:inner membrane protein